MNSFTAWSNLDRAYQSSDNFNPAFIYAIVFHISSSLCVYVHIPFSLIATQQKALENNFSGIRKRSTNLDRAQMRAWKIFIISFMVSGIYFVNKIHRFTNVSLSFTYISIKDCKLSESNDTNPNSFESVGCFVSPMTITDSLAKKRTEGLTRVRLEIFVFIRITEYFRKRQLSLLVD